MPRKAKPRNNCQKPTKSQPTPTKSHSKIGKLLEIAGALVNKGWDGLELLELPGF